VVQLVNHQTQRKYHEECAGNNQRGPQNAAFCFFAGTYQAQTFFLAGDADYNKKNPADSGCNFMDDAVHFYGVLINERMKLHKLPDSMLIMILLQKYQTIGGNHST
jgi:hypothetical protein